MLRKIGFIVLVFGSVFFWNSGILIFFVIIRNNGNGYNLGIGVFIVFFVGMYVFYVSV